MQASVRIDIEINDVTKLHETAFSDYVRQNGNSVAAAINAQDFVGTDDTPNIPNCLRQIFDRTLPVNSGITVSDSFAEVVKGPPPRTSTVLHISMKHLRPTERKAMADALGLDVIDTFPGLDKNDIRGVHCGLMLRPKEFGFCVRMPHGREGLGNLSAEMAAILDLAEAHGAWSIEFDEDEAPLEVLPTFLSEERNFLIRDFNTGWGQDDEPLYWSNADGWVDRNSADTIPESDLSSCRLPALGADPGFIDAEDQDDTRYQPS